MISLKGPGIKIVAAIVALAALAFGVYSTFFQSAGFVDGTATIVSIEEDGIASFFEQSVILRFV